MVQLQVRAVRLQRCARGGPLNISPQKKQNKKKPPNIWAAPDWNARAIKFIRRDAQELLLEGDHYESNSHVQTYVFFYEIFFFLMKMFRRMLLHCTLKEPCDRIEMEEKKKKAS
jgi:hypothetical protein